MKKHIILLLKTLINNNACVEAARTREKKYNIIAPILAVFALFFCALPVCVKGFQVKGQDVVSTSLGMDDGLYSFIENTQKDTYHSGFTMKIDKDSKGKRYLVMDDNTWKGTGTNWACSNINGKVTPQGADDTLTDLYRYTYVDDLEPEKKEQVNWLEIYFTSSTGSAFQNFYINIANNKNPLHTDQNMKVSTDGKKTALTRDTSFIVFGKEEVFVAVYNKKTSSVSSIRGDYQNTKVGTDLFNDLFVSGDKEATLNKWKGFFSEAYINTRFANTWKQTGINLGINAGVIALMGFVIWVTTRGKNNPFRIYSYWDSQKICFYACFTPGLIGLFGFLSTSLATMIFAMTCGVRVLWLSMRTLKYTAPAK